MKNKIKIIVIIPIIIIVIVIIGLIIAKKNSDRDKEEAKLIFSEITYSVPSKFEYEDYNSIKDYSYSDNDVYCYFSIRSNEKEYYGNFEEWFKENIIINLTDKVSELKQTDINGKTALNVNIENVDVRKYYYGISSTNYYYFIEYRIRDYMNGDREDINNNICYNSLDKIIS